jgi:hypothetical protein
MYKTLLWGRERFLSTLNFTLFTGLLMLVRIAGRIPRV